MYSLYSAVRTYEVACDGRMHVDLTGHDATVSTHEHIKRIIYRIEPVHYWKIKLQFPVYVGISGMIIFV